MNNLLEIENLSVEFDGFKAVDDVTLSLGKGQVLGIVGESGSGKSVTQLALMGLIPFPGVVRAKCLTFGGYDLLNMERKKRRAITGKDVSMIFQEPMTSLNPCFTVGFQIKETLKVHESGTAAQRKDRALELLRLVGISAPENRLKCFPHQLSGGMCQRVMIAMSIACNPSLLIADEPTTALDVTIQAQILDLLLDLQKKKEMAMILITHDMAMIAETVEQVIVMYAGQVVEKNTSQQLFSAPGHPYTRALLDALPERNVNSRRLPVIPGQVPGKFDRPSGCLFHPRCAHARKKCRQESPMLVHGQDGAAVRCHYPLVNGDSNHEF